MALATLMAPIAAKAGDAVTYTIDGESFEGYRAEAHGDAKGLVLVIHDWDGLTDYEKTRADMLAAMGYDALALDLFGKGNRPADVAASKRGAAKLYADRARMRKLILGGLEEARKPSPGKAVVMGYCFGGAAVL